MERTHSLTSFSDDELLRRLSDLLGRSRRDEADLVAHIGEVDRRRLYAREASPSMFAYCTEVLHLSEAEAYLRIAAARAAREHPLLLTLLADGRLHLTAIAKLAPHLTPENREDILNRAAHRSKREIEELVAEICAPSGCSGGNAEAARPTGGDDVAGPATRPGRRGAGRTASGGRRFGRSPTPSGRSWRARARAASRRGRGGRGRTASAGAALRPASPRTRPAVVEPLAPGRYKVQFTASAELHDKLERLRALMRPSVPDGDLAAIVEQAVTEKLQRLEARRFGRTQAPRKTLSQSETSPTTRQIPAAVKRAVYERDGGRCRTKTNGETMHGAPGARVPPPATVRPRRRPLGRQRRPRVRMPQRLTWPRSTMAGTPSLDIAARAPVPWSRHRLSRRDRPSVEGVSRSHRRARSESRPGNAGRLEQGPVRAEEARISLSDGESAGPRSKGRR